MPLQAGFKKLPRNEQICYLRKIGIKYDEISFIFNIDDHKRLQDIVSNTKKRLAKIEKLMK